MKSLEYTVMPILIPLRRYTKGALLPFVCDYYLDYCEGAFLERHISDLQVVLTKNHNPAPLMDEPWAEPDSQPSGVPAETISI